MTLHLRSIPGVCELRHHVGSSEPDRDRARSGAPPDLIIEVPHGATRLRELEAVRAQLRGDLPKGLADFFLVNTDVGAPELAEALALRLLADGSAHSVLVVRSEIPRTFIDCNRVIDARPEEFKAGKVTPGLPPYVRDPADQALLRGLHAAYVEATDAAHRWVSDAGGFALLLHTYAPRSVDVEVDDQIVESLHRAYRPEVEPTWPLRPEVDLIARDAAGTIWSEPLVRRLEAAFAEDGFVPAISGTYPLHPSTLGFRSVERAAPRAVCVEVRRDLLVDRFTPFAEHAILAPKVDRAAAPLARAFGGALRAERSSAGGGG